MKKLELKCRFFEILIPYKEETAFWDKQNVELKIEYQEGNSIGHFSIWKDNVEPEMIKEEWKKLKDETESFMLGMMYLGNKKVYSKEDELLYSDNDEKFSIRNDVDIEAVIKRSKGEVFNYVCLELPSLIFNCEMQASPISLPQKMPYVPLNLKRHILMITQAERLDDYCENYQAEQLKLWFLILEELESNKKDSEYHNIKCVRNFVSHDVCYHDNLIEFLKKELPSAVYIESGKEKARFYRDDKLHIALVSKYQSKARCRARKLVKQKIEKHEGNVQS
jgi:hypothetical protein